MNRQKKAEQLKQETKIRNIDKKNLLFHKHLNEKKN